MPDGVRSVWDLLAGVCREIPDVVSVDVAPSGPGGWCRIKVSFADGSAVYIGAGR